MIPGLGSRDSTVEYPQSAVEVKRVLTFKSYEYNEPAGWLKLRDRLEALEGVVVDTIYARLYDNTSTFFSEFMIIGKCHIKGEAGKYNIVEFAGFDECNAITILSSATKQTIYALRMEIGERRYQLSRIPIDEKGVMIIPEEFKIVKGFRSDDVTELKATPFVRPNGFEEVLNLVKNRIEGSDAGSPRQTALWKSIDKALKTNIDADILWASYADEGGRISKQVSTFHYMIQHTDQKKWAQQVFATLEERVQLLIETNADISEDS